MSFAYIHTHTHVYGEKDREREATDTIDVSIKNNDPILTSSTFLFYYMIAVSAK